MNCKNIFKYMIFIGLLATSARGDGKVRIVTTLPDLQYIAEQIGGDAVEATAIAKGYQDPHFVDAKPSFVLKLKQADIFVQVGLDLEIGWVPPLLETARNSKIYFGGDGYVDASRGVSLLEIPKGNVAQLRAEGDIHIFGNPHYWLDPRNGKIVAQNICEKLKQLRPESSDMFTRNLQHFDARIDSAYQVWQQKFASYQGRKIIAYHNSWPYFEQAFDIKVAAFIEPKPGIPPTPSQIVSVIKTMQEENIKVVIISPYYDDKAAQSIAGRTDGKVVAIASSVGAYPAIKTYFDLFDYNINALVKAFESTK